MDFLPFHYFCCDLYHPKINKGMVDNICTIKTGFGCWGQAFLCQLHHFAEIGCWFRVIYIYLDRLVIDSDRLFHSDSGCSPKLIDFICCILKRKEQIILNVESEVKVYNNCTVKAGWSLIHIGPSIQIQDVLRN